LERARNEVRRSEFAKMYDDNSYKALIQ